MAPIISVNMTVQDDRDWQAWNCASCVHADPAHEGYGCRFHRAIEDLEEECFVAAQVVKMYHLKVRGMNWRCPERCLPHQYGVVDGQMRLL